MTRSCLLPIILSTLLIPVTIRAQNANPATAKPKPSIPWDETDLGQFHSGCFKFKIGNGGAGTRTEELKAALVDIQRSRAADPHKWVHKVF